MYGHRKQASGVEILGMDGPPARQISRADYLVMIAAAAQGIAGPGKTPSAAQVRFAEGQIKRDLGQRNIFVGEPAKADLAVKKVKARLGSSSVSGWDSGAFWGNVKNAISTAARHAKPVLPYALPLLTASAATPLVLHAIKAHKMAQAAKRAGQAPAPSDAEPPPLPAPAGDEAAPGEASAAPDDGQAAPDDDSLKSVAGVWNGWDDREGGVEGEDLMGLDPWLHKLNPSYWLKSSRERGFVDAEKKRGKELVSLEKRRHEQDKELSAAQRAQNTLNAARQAEQESQAIEQQLQDIQQSVSSGPYGEEEQELALQGGSSEREAFERRSASSGNSYFVAGGGIPHDVYRAAVWQRAQKLAGGGRPSARHLAVAQRTVDSSLGNRGVRIVIPGARPGRVTR